MIAWLTLNAGLWLSGYLLGSIPTGYLVGKLLKGIDLRQEGSGSTGATNVLRTIGKGPAIAVLLVDILKGAAAIALVRAVYGWEAIAPFVPPTADTELWLPWMTTIAAFAALIGHSKSVWLGFQGGKAVASSLGVLLAMSWPVGLGTLGVFAVFVAISRIVSLSSIAGAIAVSGLMLLFGEPAPYCAFAIVGGLYVIWRHRSNIERLLAGTEPRIGEKLVAPDSQSQPS
ncbi:glycerol-3-phosphate 1-O-acyltransferase PlsY [Oxynema sp. CENA135]|uniref:glycerol-3-phosphate 1-O-acyltransferase PlsY n=1 Tax=Oxynema sp. CENA135 TaxID=984206 RepID=UPI00190E0DB5|nr:glycerol-3-phosphate 1-O-acyltransferase PlsY [Oxynema sp. CENA135]MBK4731143.1 glycerol-3-phosphate 1-O-acyltransferase PlsY [Oxynema sp. CENA135]